MKNHHQKFSFSILKTITVRIILTVTLASNATQALAQFSDDFSDGNFTANPVWTGSDLLFAVASGQLHLQAPAANGSAYLSTPSSALLNATWEFRLTLLFNPSGTNYTKVYVASDKPDLTAELKGYFVQAGGATDEISLYKQTGTNAVRIIDGSDGRIDQPMVDVRVRIKRDPDGNWTLFSDVGSTGTFIPEGTVHDKEHRSSSFVGMVCTYSATRSDKFYFDDFIVTGEPYVPPVPANPKDVIITEIFADPSPPVALPESEYIELFNRSETTVDLSGWTLSDGSTTAIIANTSIAAGHYLIVTANTSRNAFASYGTVVGVAAFPSLNNAADRILLANPDGTVIDDVSYDETWYQDNAKKDGGWSLELIDVNNPCGEHDNWTGSVHEAGGTPGKENSVKENKPDTQGPGLVQAFAKSETTLVILFDEKLSDQVPAIADFTFHPPLSIGGLTFVDPGLKQIMVTLSTPILPGTLYRIAVKNVRDCNNNIITNDRNTAGFVLPELADSLDVVINEVLFNPTPTGVDFVEIVNTGDKYINLKNWALAGHDNGAMVNKKIFMAGDFIVKPGAYVVITTDVPAVKSEYIQSAGENFFEADMPAFNDDAGSVVLVDEQNNIIDQFSYSDDMHSVFLQDTEGVSLERLSIKAGTTDPGNWRSASLVSGFATPGRINSNTRPEVQLADETVRLEPEIFVPVSGQPDFTRIHFHFERGGFMANVKIYDAQGRQVRELVSNAPLGTEGFFRWDGDRDDGTKARIGYYMVSFEVFDDTGIVKIFRKRLAIAAHL
ncbi:MAG TPA: lamin tail domain-containing protein [Ohtaekwangia sp.]|nr:lamin tail domain-containing protein [Ohtaekwangia sp.]